MPTDKLKIKFGIMNQPSQTTVTVPIHEWNNIQEKLKSLEQAVNSKHPFAINDAWQNGTIKVIGLDEAFASFLRNIEMTVSESKDNWRKQYEFQEKINNQEKEIKELKEKLQSIIPIKK